MSLVKLYLLPAAPADGRCSLWPQRQMYPANVLSNQLVQLFGLLTASEVEHLFMVTIVYGDDSVCIRYNSELPYAAGKLQLLLLAGHRTMQCVTAHDKWYPSTPRRRKSYIPLPLILMQLLSS